MYNSFICQEHGIKQVKRFSGVWVYVVYCDLSHVYFSCAFTTTVQIQHAGEFVCFFYNKEKNLMCYFFVYVLMYH